MGATPDSDPWATPDTLRPPGPSPTPPTVPSPITLLSLATAHPISWLQASCSVSCRASPSCFPSPAWATPSSFPACSAGTRWSGFSRARSRPGWPVAPPRGGASRGPARRRHGGGLSAPGHPRAARGRGGGPGSVGGADRRDQPRRHGHERRTAAGYGQRGLGPLLLPAGHPIILAAGIFKLPDLTGPLGDGIRGPAVAAAVCAAVAGIVSVHYLLRYFKTKSLTPFGAYCILFGAAMVLYTSIS